MVQSLIQSRLSALLGLSSKLISKKFPTYLPIEVVNISNIYTDGPTINRVSTNAAAIHIFVVLRILIPFPSPDQAAKMNNPVATIKIIILVIRLSGALSKYVRPLLICLEPDPSVEATPTTVAKIATVSLILREL